MRKLCLALLFIAPLAACKPWNEGGQEAPRARAATLAVEQVWVRLPPVAGRPGAAYFTLRGGPEPAVLEGMSSPQVQRAEMHDSVMTDGVMRMVPLPAPAVPASGRIDFAPGGKHVMLFGIDPAVEAGWRLPLTFTFRGGRQITVEAEVRAAGEAINH